jgi:glutaminase
LFPVRDPQDYDGRTALHISAAEGHLKLVQYLVAEGAKINITDRWRETPLSDALRHGHDDVATFLKGKGGVRGPPFLSLLQTRRERELS